MSQCQTNMHARLAGYPPEARNRSCGSGSIFTLQVFVCQCLSHCCLLEKEGNSCLRAKLFSDVLVHIRVNGGAGHSIASRSPLVNALMFIIVAQVKLSTYFLHKKSVTEATHQIFSAEINCCDYHVSHWFPLRIIS